MGERPDSLSTLMTDSPVTRRALLERAGIAGAGLMLAGLLPGFAEARTIRGASYEASTDTLGWSTEFIVNLDPFVIASASSSLAANQMYDFLVTFDNDLNLVPLLAESVTAETPTRYVYKLRQGPRFWDGSPVTADDVAFSLARHLDPKSAIHFQFGNVKRVAAVDPRTVVVTLKEEDPTWTSVASIAPIFKKSFAKRLGKAFGAPGSSQSVMASGPYVLSSFQTASGLQMARNEKYWGSKPKVSKLNFSFISDADTRRLAIQAGQIDGTFAIPAGSVDQWKSLSGVNLKTAPGFNVFYMSFDLDQTLWQDAHIRRAFAHATDRQGIVNAVLKGYAVPATAMVPPVMWKTIASKKYIGALYNSITKYPFNLATAKSELAKSSKPQGFSTEVRVPTILPDLISALQVMASGLKSIGVDLNVTVQPPGTWITYVLAHQNLGLQAVSSSIAYPDPMDYLSQYYRSSGAVPQGRNLANYRNAAFDSLIVAQAKATGAARNGILSKMLRTTVNELAYLPIWWQNENVALRNAFTYRGFNALYSREQWAKSIGVR